MHQTGKTYIHDMDGLGKKMPIVFGCLTISGLGLMGVPGLAGFISKWNLAEAAVDSGNPMAYVGIACLLVSALLTAIYMMSMSIRAFFPSADLDEMAISDVKDPGWKMCVPLIICVAGNMLLGLFSQPLVQFFMDVAAGNY